MPLYPRSCECGYETEQIEQISAEEVTECPQCHKISFKKRPTCPSFVRMANEGASDVYNEVEKRREKASQGHGTTTVKCSYDKWGLHEDEVITNK